MASVISNASTTTAATFSSSMMKASSTLAAPIQETLRIKKLSEFATLPKRGTPLSAGYDLAAAYDTTIPARGKGIVKTDLAMAVPPTCYGRIAPRSSLAWKKHIDVGAGVIDADYRGNVGVVLFNHSDTDLEVKHGDRVAQLILERIAMLDVMEGKIA